MADFRALRYIIQLLYKNEKKGEEVSDKIPLSPDPTNKES